MTRCATGANVDSKTKIIAISFIYVICNQDFFTKQQIDHNNLSILVHKLISLIVSCNFELQTDFRVGPLSLLLLLATVPIEIQIYRPDPEPLWRRCRPEVVEGRRRRSLGSSR
jgi:hypothetical protein